MRGGLAFLVLIGMPLTAAAAINLRFKLRPSTIFFAIVATAVTFVMLSYLSQYFEGSRYFEYRTDVSVEQNSGNSSFAQAGLGEGAVSQSLSGHALRVPLTAFGPLPWQVTNPSLLLAGIDALLWIGIWALCFVATRRLRERSEAALFIVPTAALIVYLATNASNFGLIIRLRGLGIVIVAPLAALGWVILRNQNREKREAKREALRTAEHISAAANGGIRRSVVRYNRPPPPPTPPEFAEILR
jgi:hypothetical protein